MTTNDDGPSSVTGDKAPAETSPTQQPTAERPRDDTPVAPHPDDVIPEGKEPPPPGWRLMSVVRWALVVLMAVIAAASVVYGFGLIKGTSTNQAGVVWTCPMHPSVISDQPGQCPICGMDLVQRNGSPAADAATVSHAGHRHEPTDPYLCPMHLEETGLSANDRCPLCKMKLEPRASVDAGVPGHDGAVPGLVPIELTLDRVQLIGMKTARATREALAPELRTIGVVTAPETGLARVTTRYGGWIEKLFVEETGKKIKRGELLAAVYSPEIFLAQQELLTARGFEPIVDDGGGSTSLAANARKRLDLLGVASGEIDAIIKSGQPKKTVGLYAPATGFVLEKAAVQGMYFQAGTSLFTIADLSRVWVLADIYEQELLRVKLGQSAQLTMPALPGRTFPGTVKFVYPTIDVATRTGKVRLELDNKDLDLRPGMFGNVVLTLPAANGVVIPREALVDTGEVQYVFVDKTGGRFEPRRVIVGLRTGEKVEITAGVAEGEIVVTTGNFLLDSESRLRAAVAAPAPGDAAAAPSPVNAFSCDAQFDKTKFEAKYQQCRSCEVVHAGMGTMVEDCKAAIAKPWK